MESHGTSTSTSPSSYPTKPKYRKKYKLDVKVRARVLTTVPDSTSQKFILLGQVSKKDAKGNTGRYVVIHLDFANTRSRQCGEDDFEKWYARTSTNEECLMGHKVRHPSPHTWASLAYNTHHSNGSNAERSTPTVTSETSSRIPLSTKRTALVPTKTTNGMCSPFPQIIPARILIILRSSDYNFVRQDNKCIQAGPEPIEPGVCGDPTGTYRGSSGFRRIPGNTCDREKGLKKDEPQEKPCSNGAHNPVLHMF